LIKEKALSYSIDFVGPYYIDEHNILEATMYSMHNSVESLDIKPEHLLVDGNYFNGYEGIPHTCVVKGDNTYYSIAAASILAKVSRDEYMKESHFDYPKYSWDSNKGYGSKAHREAILEHGVTPLHRVSFLKNILQS
tara:strand:+ start:285 stop:695 length:411 start_codon:yes stop_codon:yes gene_type:complete